MFRLDGYVEFITIVLRRPDSLAHSNEDKLDDSAAQVGDSTGEAQALEGTGHGTQGLFLRFTGGVPVHEGVVADDLFSFGEGFEVVPVPTWRVGIADTKGWGVVGLV